MKIFTNYYNNKENILTSKYSNSNEKIFKQFNAVDNNFTTEVIFREKEYKLMPFESSLSERGNIYYKNDIIAYYELYDKDKEIDLYIKSDLDNNIRESLSKYISSIFSHYYINTSEQFTFDDLYPFPTSISIIPNLYEGKFSNYFRIQFNNDYIGYGECNFQNCFIKVYLNIACSQHTIERIKYEIGDFYMLDQIHIHIIDSLERENE